MQVTAEASLEVSQAKKVLRKQLAQPERVQGQHGLQLLQVTLSESFWFMARSLCRYPVAIGESFRDVMLYILENKSAGQSTREGFLKSKGHSVY